MKKAVIHTRGNNTAGQILVCREYAKSKGYEIIGETSESLREAFLHIDNYEVLIILDETRLTKRAGNFEAIKEAFEEIGIEVETAREYYESNK